MATAAAVEAEAEAAAKSKTFRLVAVQNILFSAAGRAYPTTPTTPHTPPTTTKAAA